MGLRCNELRHLKVGDIESQRPLSQSGPKPQNFLNGLSPHAAAIMAADVRMILWTLPSAYFD